MSFLLSLCLLLDQVLTFLVRWSGSHIRWGQPFRLRHVTTGKYLSLMEDKSLLLMDKEKADVKSTAFTFRSSKVRQRYNFGFPTAFPLVLEIQRKMIHVLHKFLNSLFLFYSFLFSQTHFLNHWNLPRCFTWFIVLWLFSCSISIRLLLVFLDIDSAVSTDLVLLLHSSVRGASAEAVPHRLAYTCSYIQTFLLTSLHPA